MTDLGEITTPEKLTPEHDVSGFDSGVPQLDGWLKRRALAKENSGASRTYVVCAGGALSVTTRVQTALWRKAKRRVEYGAICLSQYL